MSEEREAMQAAYAQWIRENLDSGYRPGTRGAWIAALEWQAARQSAEPVYDKSVVARIATQMGWTPPDATTLRVLSSHAIRKHEGVTIFGDPAQVLKVMAAIEGSGAMGQEPVAFRWRRRVRDKWEYETRATLSDADTVRVMLEDGWEAEWLGIVAAPIGDNGSQPAESKRVAWIALTDEDRKAAFESLPDMLDGFLKTWGWLHFAKEIERRCKEKNEHVESKRVELTDAEIDSLAEQYIRFVGDMGIPRVQLRTFSRALLARVSNQKRCDGSGAVTVSTEDWSECPSCRGAGCKPVPHQWNDDGERCVKCGDKDWMADSSCSERLLDRAQAKGE